MTAVVIDWKIRKGGLINAKHWRNIKKRAYAKIAGHWKKKMLPFHFTNAASTRYGYTKRKGERGSGRPFRGSYTEKKLKRFGHTRPLEWRGMLKKETRGSTVKATSKSSYVAVKGRALNIRNIPNSSVNMRHEIVAIDQKDIGVLVRIADNQIENDTNRLNRGGRHITALF